MQNYSLQKNSSSILNTEDTTLYSESPDNTPDNNDLVSLTSKSHTDLVWEENYWKSQHKRAVKREITLKEVLREKNAHISNLQQHLKSKETELVHLQSKYGDAIIKINCLTEELTTKDAKILDLTQRLYGKKSEKGAGNPDVNPNNLEGKQKRPRGQQKGSKGHGRTNHSHLPVVNETVSLIETECNVCGSKYSLLSGDKSDVVEITVSAHVRRIVRQKCVKNCTCTPGNKIIIAPKPAKLIPKSPYGASIWIELLLKKFLHGIPVNRTLQDFKSLGLTLAPGTVPGGFKKLIHLFEPIYKACYQQQMKENRFHNDETRWEVYQEIEGKTGHRWYLWLIQSKSVVYYRIDPTRSADVPIEHFADLESQSVIVICDRYSAYKKLARLNLAIILAFCWAHVRRDFLDFSKRYPELKDWGLDWADAISKLFHLNNNRIALLDQNLPLKQQSLEFQNAHNVLGEGLTQMKQQCDTLLHEHKIAEEQNKPSTLIVEQFKLLESMQEHWAGLTIFHKHPEVKMDNNTAERTIRNPVVGRKGYYGSGSIWSAEFTAMMFSILQTLLLWGFNPRTWMNLYLDACSQKQGNPPPDLSLFLPWCMSEEQRQSSPNHHIMIPPKIIMDTW